MLLKTPVGNPGIHPRHEDSVKDAWRTRVVFEIIGRLGARKDNLRHKVLRLQGAEAPPFHTAGERPPGIQGDFVIEDLTIQQRLDLTFRVKGRHSLV